MSQTLLGNYGNCHDIHCHIQCCYERISIQYLEESIANEKENRNRSTVLKLMESTLKKKKKEAK